MERAARLIKNNKQSSQIMTDDDIARATWATAVGKSIAAHTSGLRLVRNTLIVEVEDAIWQKQLHTLRGQILNRLHHVMASAVVQEIEFRIAIPRRQPQRADGLQSASPPLLADSSDDAESIRDPVLKKVYRLSRKKATA